MDMTRDELLIEASELASIIDKPDLRLFDATVLLNPQAGESGLSRYNDGHLPGAAFLDHLAISKQQASPMFMLPGEAELATAIGNLGIDNNSDVVIYSTDSIMWATRAWWVLRYAGHTRVRVLDGGRSGWQGKLDTNPYQYIPTTFEPNLTPAMIADKEEVLASINNGATCTINALPYSFYTGEADVPYARQGHITGSLSLSFDQMMEGEFVKSNASLEAAFDSYDKAHRLITYCGGGIAATLTATCARLVGFEDVAVYDGSMSEWLEAGLPTTQGSEPGHLP
tara:strand:- start:183 stop:1031 length:849 start_codon:yes stop_codon:yes gene_type:complete